MRGKAGGPPGAGNPTDQARRGVGSASPLAGGFPKDSGQAGKKGLRRFRAQVEWDFKDLVLIQGGLELVLLAVLGIVLWRQRRQTQAPPPAVMPEGLQEGIERFLAESERISAAFQRNLDDKRELTADLILKLDRRLADYRSLLESTEAAVAAAEKRLAELGGEIAEKARLQTAETKANPAAPEVRAMVLQLARKGLSVEDIAVRAQLHRGEVELIIDLEQQFGV